jgi:hypothetical protein
MAICLSHSGDAIYSSSAPSNELFVGTTDGVFLLARDKKGGEWRTARQSLNGYHVCSMLIEPSSGAMFAATHNGGVRSAAIPAGTGPSATGVSPR